jgi:predicted nucleic acid-binding protein
VKIVKKEVYQDKIPLAEETMEEIDITDSPFLALALALNCPLWSNDGHFKKQNLVKTYTTKKIVEFLEKQN